MRALFFTIVILLGNFISPAFAVSAGETAPPFDVRDITGKAQSLSAYKGKIVVLEWNNPGCPFVHKHYDSGNMQGLQKWATGKGVVWLTVNSSGEGQQGFMHPAEAKANLVKVGGNETAYILDPKGTLGKLYGAKATPHMFVIDAKGILAYAGAIDDQPTPDPESLKTAHNYVKSSIESLLAGKPVGTKQTRAYGCSVKYAD